MFVQTGVDIMHVTLDVNTEVEVKELTDLPKFKIIYGESANEN